MKLEKPVKKKKLAVVRLELDEDDDKPQVKKPESSKIPAAPLLADGRYVQIHKGGKGRDERWITLGPFSIEKQKRIWTKKSRSGKKRVRMMRKEGRVTSIGHDTLYLKIAHAAIAKQEDSFFVAAKFKKAAPKLWIKKRFKHKAQMKLKKLHDAEHYIVSIATRDGTTIGIVTGYKLKTKEFWRHKLAAYPMAEEGHWTRRINPPEGGKYPKQVEVLLPWYARPSKSELAKGEQGRRMVTFVTPVSATDMEKKERNDPAYAALVKKYQI